MKTAKKDERKSKVMTRRFLSIPSPFKVKDNGSLEMTVSITKNGHLLAKTDLPFDEMGIAYLIRNRDDWARRRVPRRKTVRLD